MNSYRAESLYTNEERKSRPPTQEWNHEQQNFEYSNNEEDESHTYNGNDQQLIESGIDQVEESGSAPNFNKSNRTKRQKWSKKPVNHVASTNVNQKINARTVAQMERIENITNEANKQEAMINQIYEKIQEDKKITEELKKNMKNKNKVNVEKPNLAPNNPALYNAEQWLANIGGSDIEVHKENTKAKKKANAAKVASVVDRLSKPADKNKLRRDPDEEEIKYIMNKYDTSEKRIGGGAKKKFEYRNQLPDESSADMIPQKDVSFVPNYSQGSTKDDNYHEISENPQNSKLE